MCCSIPAACGTGCGGCESFAAFDVQLISTYIVVMRSNLPRLAVSPATVHEQCFCLNAQRAARRLARLYDEGLRPLGFNRSASVKSRTSW
jgi:hypothetical protein